MALYSYGTAYTKNTSSSSPPMLASAGIELTSVVVTDAICGENFDERSPHHYYRQPTPLLQPLTCGENFDERSPRISLRTTLVILRTPANDLYRAITNMP